MIRLRILPRTSDSTANEGASSAGEAPAETASVDTVSLAKRARVGTLLLGVRSVAIELVTLGGNVLLYRVLSPRDFGVFAIVQFAISLFALVGDAGLAAALIQKKEEPNERELSSIWTLQLLLGGVALGALGIFAPAIVAIWPSMPDGSTMLMRCAAAAFLLTLLRVVPTVIIERRLHYAQLAVLEVLLTLGFFGPAVLLAYLGYGALSLGIAMVTQAALGIVAAFAFEPFRPRLTLDWNVLRPIFRYGVAFQAKHVFGFATSAVAPVFGGAALGQAALGQIGWAQSTGFFPLQLVQLISRVGFPLFSRLQSERAALMRAVERSIHVCALGTFLFASIVFGLGEPLVRIVFTERWLPTLPLLDIYTAAIGVGFLTPVLMPVLDAMGRPGVSTRLAALSTILAWSLVPIGIALDGTRGFALGYALVVLIGNIAMVLIIHRTLPGVRVVGVMVKPAVAAVGAAVLGHRFLGARIQGPAGLVGAILVVSVMFGVILLAIDRSALRDVRSFVQRRGSGETTPP